MNDLGLEILTDQQLNKVRGGSGPISLYAALLSNLATPIPIVPGRAFASAGEGGETAGSFNPTMLGD
jgi:hypothetical protein